MKIHVLIFSLFMMLANTSHAVLVDFSGTLDVTTGPFSAGDSYSGSFVLDESVEAMSNINSSGTTSVFRGAVDNFMLSIAGNAFTGENGFFVQSISSIRTTDFFRLRIGGSSAGTLTGNVDGDLLTAFIVDWVGLELFDTPTIVAKNLDIDDFDSRRRVIFSFNDSGNILSNATDINFSASVVPVPAAAWLFGTFLFGVFGFSRVKRKI